MKDVKPHVEAHRVTLSLSAGAAREFIANAKVRTMTGNAYGVVDEVVERIAKAIEGGVETVELSLLTERLGKE